MANRNINELVVHHSAVEQKDLKKALNSFNIEHKKTFGRNKGYAGTEYIQYHFVIGVDGEVKKTCSINEVLYHASNYKVNQRSIGVCLSGNLDKHPPTAKQYGALLKLIWEFNIKVTFHSDYSNKSCPGNMFNKSFVRFMAERPQYITMNLRKRDIVKQKINHYFEYHQTKSDCTRYGAIGMLSDVIGRGLTTAEVTNFKRWSEMFSDVGSGSNGIIQTDIILKRWNFNNPNNPVGCYAATPAMKDKRVGKLLARGHSIAYARITGYDFVKDKRDGIIDKSVFDATGWHFTRAMFDRKTGYITEVNNYEGEKNNIFKYKDFLAFANNGNIKDYVLIFYKMK